MIESLADIAELDYPGPDITIAPPKFGGETAPSAVGATRGVATSADHQAHNSIRCASLIPSYRPGVQVNTITCPRSPRVLNTVAIVTNRCGSVKPRASSLRIGSASSLATRAAPASRARS